MAQFYFTLDIPEVGALKPTSDQQPGTSWDGVAVGDMADAHFFKVGMGKDWRQNANVAEVAGTPDIKPLIIRKRLDANTPLLMQACAGTKSVKTGSFHMFQLFEGEHVNFFSINITNAKIISHEIVVPEAEHNNDQEQVPYEEIQIVYTTMSLNHKGTGDEATGITEDATEGMLDTSTGQAA